MKKVLCVLFVMLMGVCFSVKAQEAAASETPVVDVAAVSAMDDAALADYVNGLGEDALVNFVKVITDGDDTALANRVLAVVTARLNAMTDAAARNALANKIIDASLYLVPGTWSDNAISFVYVKSFFASREKIIDQANRILINDEVEPVSTRAYKK